MCDDVHTMDLSGMGGVANAQVMGTVVQHVSATGELLFQWSPFDHFDITDLDSTSRVGVNVNWTVVSGPAARLNGEGKSASTKTDASGWAKVALTQETPMVGVNEIQFTAVRPATKDECGCRPEAMLGTWVVHKTWISPTIAITKTAPARETVGQLKSLRAILKQAGIEVETFLQTK